MWNYISQDTNEEISVLIYIPEFLDNEIYNDVKEYLQIKENNFKSGTNLLGNEILRKQLWFHKEGKYFCEKWKSRIDRWESENYDNLLLNLENKIKEKLKTINFESIVGNYYKKDIIDTNFNFNSCLINLYRNGDDFIAPHRDSILSFGEYPTIVGLSIGTSRTMKIKKNKQSSINSNSSLSTEFELENNSVFIMMGASQKYYTHEVLREPDVKDKRFSLTFRNWIG